MWHKSWLIVIILFLSTNLSIISSHTDLSVEDNYVFESQSSSQYNLTMTMTEITNLDSSLMLNSDGIDSLLIDQDNFTVLRDTSQSSGLFGNLSQSAATNSYELYDSKHNFYLLQNLSWLDSQIGDVNWDGKIYHHKNETFTVTVADCQRGGLLQGNGTFCAYKGIPSEDLIIVVQVLNFTHSIALQEEYVFYYEDCGRQQSTYTNTHLYNNAELLDYHLSFDSDNVHLALAQKQNRISGSTYYGSIVSNCEMMLNGSTLVTLSSDADDVFWDHISLNRTSGQVTSTNIQTSETVSQTTKMLMGESTVFFNSGSAPNELVGCYNLQTGSTSYVTNNAVIQRNHYGLNLDMQIIKIKGSPNYPSLIDSNCQQIANFTDFDGLIYNKVISTGNVNQILLCHSDTFVGDVLGLRLTKYQSALFELDQSGNILRSEIGPIDESFCIGIEKAYHSNTILNTRPNINGWFVGVTDSDIDTYPDFMDDFPQESTQFLDSDLDGFGDNNMGYLGDDCPVVYGNSTVDLRGCLDGDGDGWSDQRDNFPNEISQWNDTDGDGYGDNASGNLFDSCILDYGDSNKAQYWGCPDADGDGWADDIDDFISDISQWLDSDGDGFGDSIIGFEGDSCPNIIGNSTEDFYGCEDIDGDGWSNSGDAFQNEPTQWSDRDFDGYGDNQEIGADLIDAFPGDSTQWNDTDEDGHGDNPFGTQGDWFPNDPTRWQDSDQDGFADEDDTFPNEITQWNDTDGDGYGDEETGNRGDAFPNDAAEWLDSDMDGLGDNADAFPFDPTQKVDADGDGMGDNPMGIGADKFPDDVTQWGDIDGDGYGDNPNGTSPDAFITDATQWSDEDGDGYGDNPAGRLYDQFPLNPTQWLDEDGDGLGDNQSGTNADPFLNDFDNDAYNDSIDPLPKLPSPGDLDNDGVLDVNDLFPDDSREWADNDGDGEGNNADTDDDNDGWADTDEVRLGTDPFGAADVPVDSFEIVIPGTAVGLGAWDLIGMFGGIPLFMWIGFGFVTRNGRTAKYEGLLREAQSRDELEDVARLWEYSLMLRMLGPHQGIRLERLRAELDDVFEAQNQKLSSIEPQEHDQTQMVEQAMQEEQKSLPSIESSQPEITALGNPDGKGYEWYTDAQETSWYRNEGSNSEWQRFDA
jgi:hypothetical protein